MGEIKPMLRPTTNSLIYYEVICHCCESEIELGATYFEDFNPHRIICRKCADRIVARLAAEHLAPQPPDTDTGTP